MAKEKPIEKNESKEKKAPAQNSNTETSTKKFSTWARFIPHLTSVTILGALASHIVYRASKERNIARKFLEDDKKAKHQNRKLNAYAIGMKHILESIKEGDWVNNDLLLAKLNYDKYGPTFGYKFTMGCPSFFPSTNVNFMNTVSGTSKNNTATFHDLSKKLNSQESFKIYKENFLGKK